jgi:hypothetical protein
MSAGRDDRQHARVLFVALPLLLRARSHEHAATTGQDGPPGPGACLAYSGCSRWISEKKAFLYLPYGRTPPWVDLSHILNGIKPRDSDRLPITQLQ